MNDWKYFWHVSAIFCAMWGLSDNLWLTFFRNRLSTLSRVLFNTLKKKSFESTEIFFRHSQTPLLFESNNFRFCQLSFELKQMKIIPFKQIRRIPFSFYSNDFFSVQHPLLLHKKISQVTHIFFSRPFIRSKNKTLFSLFFVNLLKFIYIFYSLNNNLLEIMRAWSQILFSLADLCIFVWYYDNNLTLNKKVKLIEKKK